MCCGTKFLHKKRQSVNIHLRKINQINMQSVQYNSVLKKSNIIKISHWEIFKIYNFQLHRIYILCLWNNLGIILFTSNAKLSFSNLF